MLLTAAREVHRAGNAVRRRISAALAGPPPRPLHAGGLAGRVLGEIADVGACRLRAAELIGPDAARTLEATASQLPDGFERMEGDAVLAFAPQIYRIGLDPAVLDLVEAWLGAPCYCLGPTLKREAVGAPLAGTRQWHLDVEDARMIRVLFYLSDAAEGCGPFEYIPQRHSQAAQASMRYRSGYIADDAMARLVPAAMWTQATGVRGDAVVFDGTRIFHRAQPPVSADRLSLTFAYTSRRPFELRLSARLAAAARRELVSSLDERAAACLPPARLF